MSLDPTARLANVKDSVKKYFVDNIYSIEGKQVTFDKGLKTPNIQGTAINEWVSVNLGTTDMDHMGTQLLNIYTCTRQDPEGFRLAQLRDKVMGYLSDTTQTDGMKRITLYRSRAAGAWTQVGSFLVQDVIESGDLEAPDETKYRILTATLRWSAKI